MKFHLVVIASLTAFLAPALAQSVPQGSRPAVSAKDLGYNPEDPNLKTHKASDKDKTEGYAHKLPAASLARPETEQPLQNLGVLSANNPNAQASPQNSFFTFKGSTNPSGSTGKSTEQKAKQ